VAQGLRGPRLLAAAARVRLGSAYERFRARSARPTRAARSRAAQARATLRWALDTVPASRRFKGHVAWPARTRGGPRRASGDRQARHQAPSRALSLDADARRAARLEMYTGGSTRNPMRFFLQKHVTRAKEVRLNPGFPPRRRAVVRRGHDPGLRGRTVPRGAADGQASGCSSRSSAS
jgi:hypothetical protein